MDLGGIEKLFEYKSGDEPYAIDIGQMHSAFLIDEEHKDNCYVAFNLRIVEIDGLEFDEKALVYDEERK